MVCVMCLMLLLCMLGNSGMEYRWVEFYLLLGRFRCGWCWW